MEPSAAKVAQHGHGPWEVEQSVPIGGPMVHVVVDRAGTEDQFVQLEPAARLVALHTTDDAQPSDRDALAFLGRCDLSVDPGQVTLAKPDIA